MSLLTFAAREVILPFSASDETRGEMSEVVLLQLRLDRRGGGLRVDMYWYGTTASDFTGRERPETSGPRRYPVF